MLLDLKSRRVIMPSLLSRYAVYAVGLEAWLRPKSPARGIHRGVGITPNQSISSNSSTKLINGKFFQRVLRIKVRETYGRRR